MAAVALGVFVWALLQTACTPLPTIIFMSLLCLLAVFGGERQPTGAGGAPGSHGGVAAGRVGGGVTSAAGPLKGLGPLSRTPGRHGNSGKKRR